jgi:hypothetical protein
VLERTQNTRDLSFWKVLCSNVSKVLKYVTFIYIKILYLRTIHLNPLGVWKTECGAEHRPKEVYLNRDELHLLLFALRNTHISLLSLSASKTPSFAIESTSLTLDLSMIQFGIHHQISITFTRKSVMLRRCTLQVAPDHMLLQKS